MTTTTIQMPEGITLDEATYSSTFGRFIIQPLEKGYGITIGNSFRRVLLSSLPGSAITSIKIDKVMHEFSTIHGVVEDVSEMILNMKEIRLKALNPKVGKCTVALKGPHTFTAKDIQETTTEYEILNQEQYIATLGPDAEFEMEIRFGQGRGYIPADEHKTPDQVLGTINVDAIYTPIKNVRILTENTRVGGSTDYDKLTIEITTDGSITPKDSLYHAARILNDHIQMFLEFDQQGKSDAHQPVEDEEAVHTRNILLKPVDQLELSVRSYNCLRAANIKILADLVRREESEMLKFRNFGRKSLAELGEIVLSFGLHFGMDVEKYLKETTPASE